MEEMDSAINQIIKDFKIKPSIYRPNSIVLDSRDYVRFKMSLFVEYNLNKIKLRLLGKR